MFRVRICGLLMVYGLCRCSQAFEQAGKEPGFVFPKQGDISVERIKQSKYFKALIQHSKGSTQIEVWLGGRCLFDWYIFCKPFTMQANLSIVVTTSFDIV